MVLSSAHLCPEAATDGTKRSFLADRSSAEFEGRMLSEAKGHGLPLLEPNFAFVGFRHLRSHARSGVLSLIRVIRPDHVLQLFWRLDKS